MRKVLFALLSAIVSAMCIAGETVWVYDSNGTRTPYELAKVDSLSFAEPGYLYFSSDVINLSGDGGRFSVWFNSEKPWTATVSDPTAIILSKSSGDGYGWLDMSAFPNTGSQPYSATVTLKHDDGTTAVLTVNVSVKNEYIDFYLVDDEGGLVPYTDTSYINVPRSGGEFEIYVSSNTYWYVRGGDGIRASQSSGKYNETVKFSVDPNTNKYEHNPYLAFRTIAGDDYLYVRMKQEGSNISVGPALQRFPSTGGVGKLVIKSNSKWSVSSNKEWLKFEQVDGALNDSIAIYVDESDNDSEATAIITVTTDEGSSAQCLVDVGLWGKCKASDYEWVTIGTQTWMAENYRCSKYDTESEAYNASWLTNNTIPTSEESVYTPYYIDAIDKANWSTTEYADSLNGERIAKLGYLYNWAAAVGVSNGIYSTEPFTGNRQGICPNGWHIPTKAEWQTLYDYIYSDQQLSDNTVGKYLKTISGWYNNYENTDSYGFAALPSGDTNGSRVYDVGKEATFCTATPSIYDCYRSYVWRLNYIYKKMYNSFYNDNNYGASVRCLKN